MKVTKSYINQLVKEELQRKLREGERFDAMLAKKKAERRYQDNKAEIDPLKDRFQTDDRYKDSAYIDDIMAVAPNLTREQAIEIAELFSDEVGMADRLNEEKSAPIDNLLKSWAQKRAKADDAPSERPGMYDVNGGQAVFSHVDGYLYYGSARDPQWKQILSAADPLSLQQSMINVTAPMDAESPSMFNR